MPNAATEYKAGSAGLWRSAGNAASRLAARVGLSAVAALGLTAGLAPTQAQAEISIGAKSRAAAYAYRFYVGGVKIGEADFKAKLGDGDYFIEGLLRTDGVSDWFVKATVAAEGRGRVDRKVRPKSLDVSGKFDKGAWKMSIYYDGDAPSAVNSHPPFRKKPYEIDPRRQNGALDPLGAMIATLAPTRSGTPCRRTIPIFDGRKRYDIIFGKQIFKGKSKSGRREFECEARWKRVGGFKKKHMRKKDILFTARFEVIGGLTVPTKVWGETDFGDAVAILRNRR